MILFSLIALTAEAARVMEIRLRMIALGKAAPAEMLLMMTEKLEALERASNILLFTGDVTLVVESYRKIVAANEARLSAATVAPAQKRRELPRT